MTEQLNTNEYIEDFISDKNPATLISDQNPKLINSMKIGFKSIFLGRKWFIYLFLNLIMLVVMLIFEKDKFADPGETFILFILENTFPFIFVFGCLILSLPLSADEISDKVIDLYIVRPIKRETYWLSRVLVLNFVVFFMNVLIYLIFFLYFMIFSTDGFIESVTSDYMIFLKMIPILLSATLIYSTLFLFVGMIGNRGFTLGLFLAIFEPFFLGMLFLSGNKYIPQTNVMRVLFYFFESDVEFNPNRIPDISIEYAFVYTLIFPVLMILIGGYYLRKREFN